MVGNILSVLFLLPFCLGKQLELCEGNARYYINNNPDVHTCNYDEDNYSCKEMGSLLLDNNTTVCLNLNEQNGTLEVIFPLKSEYDMYTVELWKNDSLRMEKECQTFMYTDDIAHLHSKEELAHSTCRTENARNYTHSNNVTGSIVFQYVYTGCYYISITSAFSNGTKGSIVYTQPFTLKTKYKKTFLTNLMPLVKQHCSNITGKLTYHISITNFTLLFGEKIAIEMGLNRGGCSNIKSANVAVWRLSFTKGTRILRCQKHEKHDVMPSCIQTSADSVMCTITEKVEEGHHCITIEPVDRVRCGTTSLWTLGKRYVGICEIWSEFDCIAHSSPPPTEDKIIGKPDLVIYLLSGFGCLFLIIAFISFIILRRCYKQSFPKPISDAQCVLHPLKCKVLLLYAQDCEPFMKLMTTFRELLSDVAECEVLDCFDPQRAEELAVNPSEWMCGWASNLNVKIVVVTSDCAVAHQKALASNGSLQYRRPIPFNDLFLLGLKEVIYIHKNEYLRTLVVRFNVSGEDFSYLTPYTRFVLPQHLELLLENLNPNIDTSVLNECKYGEKLQNDYEALLHCREQNPHYFTQLFEQEVI